MLIPMLKPMLKPVWSCLLLAGLLGACATDKDAPTPASQPTGFQLDQSLQAPDIPREFRGAWVATVANIDWPSRPGLTAEAMRDEIVANVAEAKRLNLNALLLQVRPSADAIYPSALEPWSEVLTGTQGQTPTWVSARPDQAPFDPLQTWIDEANKSGIEIHAWFNPYRARHTSAKSAPSTTHISQTRPQLVKAYGGFGWLDPGETAAAEHSLKVIEDVTRRYNISGVHIDDYFYPYPVNTVTRTVTGGTLSVRIDFPDEPSWQAYQKAGGKLSRADWRRDNVNRFVQQMDERVRAIKPHVAVSVSPFGLGKPALRPEGIRGFSQFDELYADVELWMQRGWMDFLVPQLYWPIEQKAQAFPVLLDYWAAQNPKGLQVYAGLYTSRVTGGTITWQPQEVAEQIRIVRERSGLSAATPPTTATNALLSGHVHFSWVALKQNRMGLADQTLSQNPSPALAPVSWRTPAAPAAAAPKLLRALSTHLLVQAEANTSKVALWQRVQSPGGGTEWRLSIRPAREPLALRPEANAVVVAGIDYLGRESTRVGAVLERAP